MKRLFSSRIALPGLAILGLILPCGAASAAPVNLPHSARPLAEGKKEDKGEKIALDKLPKKVVDSVKKEMPGSRLTKAYKKTEDGKTTYLLDDVKVGKKGWDVTLNEEGVILKKEECHDND